MAAGAALQGFLDSRLEVVKQQLGHGSGLTTPIESKWVEHGWRRQAFVLEGLYGHGVMATKSILDLEHPSWAIPAPLVACLLG